MIYLEIGGSSLAAIDARPALCPRAACGSTRFYRHQPVQRQLYDLSQSPHPLRSYAIYRYQCCRCGATLRNLGPHGIKGRAASPALHDLAAVYYAVGLSYAQISTLFAHYKIYMHRTTLCRALRQRGPIAPRLRLIAGVRALPASCDLFVASIQAWTPLVLLQDAPRWCFQFALPPLPAPLRATLDAALQRLRPLNCSVRLSEVPADFATPPYRLD